MKPYYEHGGITIYHGDCLAVMREMPAASVTAICTDPPYGLEFMGRDWDHGVPGVPFWSEALRVTKPGGMLLAFGGTRTFHRLTCAIEDAGWEVRDCLSWMYGSGFPKSLDVSKAVDAQITKGRSDSQATGDGRSRGTSQHFNEFPKARYEKAVHTPTTDAARRWYGYGTALKPAWEPIILAMKPLDGTFAANAIKHGVAGVNVEGCRIGENAGWSYPNGRGGQGWHGRESLSKNLDVPMSATAGRWPANLALDEEAAAMLDEQSGIQKDGVAVNRNRVGPKYSAVMLAPADKSGQPDAGYGGTGGASRFFYCAKADKRDRGPDNTHPTVKPHKLMRWLVRMVTMPSDTVILDPFMGSGSTLVAAQAEHVRAIGIEANEAYCEIASKRLAQEVFEFT